MKTPTELELQHMIAGYDPAAARAYYLRTRKLKGRKKGNSNEGTGVVSKAATRALTGLTKGKDSRTGKSKAQIGKDARAHQRKELTARINSLEGKLKKLEALIKKKSRDEDSEDRKGKAKKERAAKEADKPKSAAEKAKAAREGKKDRAKNQQKEKSADKKGSDKKDSDKSSSKKEKAAGISDLKVLAKKVKGKIVVAKQKLAAL